MLLHTSLLPLRGRYQFNEESMEFSSCLLRSINTITSHIFLVPNRNAYMLSYLEKQKTQLPTHIIIYLPSNINTAEHAFPALQTRQTTLWDPWIMPPAPFVSIWKTTPGIISSTPPDATTPKMRLSPRNDKNKWTDSSNKLDTNNQKFRWYLARSKSERLSCPKRFKAISHILEEKGTLPADPLSLQPDYICTSPGFSPFA